MSDFPPPPRRGRPKGSTAFPWRGFFHQSTTPVFVLGKGRRLRYANPAWERLTGTTLGEALGMVCSTRRHSTPLAAALAPTPDVQAGRVAKVRRAAPPLRTGPPWWDVAFTPLAGDDGLIGLVGVIAVVGEPVAAAARKIPAEVMSLRESHGAHFSLDLFTGRIAAQLRHAANTAVPVWLVGEPGSGKETAARVVHHSGTQRERTFLALDCAGLQPFLIESLFSGHGGLAESNRVGTVYLKDPAALPRDLQQEIADRFSSSPIATGGIASTESRLICGSTVSAEADVTAGRLIPEFHTALCVLELRVPPLRERIVELPRLVEHFLSGVAIEPAAVDVLKALAWPGNLRELRRVLGEAHAAAGTSAIRGEHLPWDLRVKAGLVGNPPPDNTVNLDDTLAAIESRLIRLALTRAKGNTSKAADSLGLARARLLRRIEALGIRE